MSIFPATNVSVETAIQILNKPFYNGSAYWLRDLVRELCTAMTAPHTSDTNLAVIATVLMRWLNGGATTKLRVRVEIYRTLKQYENTHNVPSTLTLALQDALKCAERQHVKSVLDDITMDE